MKKREQEIDHLLDEYFYCDYEKGILYNKTQRANRLKIDSEAGSLSQGYKKVDINGRKYQVHRIIWRMYSGKWPENYIDHIDGDKLNNKITNLREVTNRENTQNMKKHRNGKLCGFYYHKRDNLYGARIYINGFVANIGYFKSEEMANQQYLKACKAIKIKEFKTAKELREYLKSAAGQSFDILKDPNL